MDTEKKYFLLINSTHYSWNPGSTAIKKLSEEEFFSSYNKETDALTFFTHTCEACPKKEAEKLGKDGVPTRFENDSDYLLWVYKNEKNPQLLIKGKAVYDQQNK
jgi:hypothetical protein